MNARIRIMRFKAAPDGEDAYEFANSRKPGSLTLILGECRVKFKGRAESFLDYGERLVLVKKDGSVLVHRGEGCDAVNWQPPGTKTSFLLGNGQLVLHAYRIKPPEKMRIRFRKIKLIAHSQLKDKAEIKLTGMESDYVDMVKSSPGVIEEGLRITGRERKTASGAIDLYGRDKNNTPVILEVKRGTAGIPAVYQLEAYVQDMKRKNKEAEVRGILCAPRVPPMVQNLLRERGLEYRAYSCSFELSDDKQRTLMDYSKKEKKSS